MELLLYVWKKSTFWLIVLCGCLLFCWRLSRKRRFPLRFALGVAANLVFALAWSACFEPYSHQSVWIECSRYLIHFLLFVLMIRGCYECDWTGAVFCVMCGYCLQHMANRIHVAIWMEDLAPWEWLKEPSLYLLVAVVYLAGYLAFRKRTGGVTNVIRVDGTGQLFLSVVALFAMNVVEMVQFLYLPVSETAYVNMSGPVMAAIFSCVTLMLEYNLLSCKTAETERNTLKEIVQEKRNQTEFEKKMIETVNINAHDLKYKIASGTLLPDAKRDIEQAVEEYDTALHTGNEALDILLSQKKRNCLQNGIQLICMADGKCLSFMSESDIFTLMGNILDNAIEGVQRLKDPDSRIINLSIVGKDSFAHIREENYFQDALLVSGKTLLTTKEDKEHHGYGMKSISLLVEKYGGHCKIETDGNLFALDILFPIRS